MNLDFSDTSQWWVLEEGPGWAIALNGKNKSNCVNRVTGEQCSFSELIQKTWKVNQDTAARMVADAADQIEGKPGGWHWTQWTKPDSAEV